MPKATSLPLAAAGIARRMAAWKAARSLQHVIRGQDQHERVLARELRRHVRRERDGRRGVAPDRLEQDGRRRHSHFAQLLGDQESVRFVANHHRRRGVGKPASRAAVSWIMVRSPVSARSCFGSSSRDSGHRRVPAPPERITGTSLHGPNRTAGARQAGCGLPATDRVVREALLLHRRRVVEIAAVENHRRLERLLQMVEVRAAEFLPFRDDRQRIGAFERLARASAVSVRSARSPQDALRFLRRGRIECAHLRARLPQLLRAARGWRFAHVVGARLECQAPDREGLAVEIRRRSASRSCRTAPASAPCSPPRRRRAASAS